MYLEYKILQKIKNTNIIILCVNVCKDICSIVYPHNKLQNNSTSGFCENRYLVYDRYIICWTTIQNTVTTFKSHYA